MIAADADPSSRDLADVQIGEPETTDSSRRYAPLTNAMICRTILPALLQLRADFPRIATARTSGIAILLDGSQASRHQDYCHISLRGTIPTNGGKERSSRYSMTLPSRDLSGCFASDDHRFARDRSRKAGTRSGPVHESPTRKCGRATPCSFQNSANVAPPPHRDWHTALPNIPHLHLQRIDVQIGDVPWPHRRRRHRLPAIGATSSMPCLLPAPRRQRKACVPPGDAIEQL